MNSKQAFIVDGVCDFASMRGALSPVARFVRFRKGSTEPELDVCDNGTLEMARQLLLHQRDEVLLILVLQNVANQLHLAPVGQE